MRIKISRGWLNILKEKAKSACASFISASKLKKFSAFALILFSLALLISAYYYRNDFQRHVLRPTLYRMGVRARPEQFIIDIKQMDLQKLAYKREVALSAGVLFSTSDDYVPAEITFQNKTYPVKMRLKGDGPDHWKDRNKWSFRIKIRDGKTILGMRQFSIQNPDTRGYIIEWLFHQFQKYNNLISLRYDFIDVILNGKPLGLYAIEEHFDKILVENNHRREGPVIRFNDSLYWHHLANDTHDLTSYQEAYWTGAIDTFHPQRTRRKEGLFKQYQKGKNLLESFRQGILPTSKVFDMGKLATFFALFDIWGNPHAHEYHNVRFYYNPVTALLEPIGYDSKDMGKVSHLSGSTAMNDRKQYWSTWELSVFEDLKFTELYIATLKSMASKEHIDGFFQEINGHYQNQLSILYDNFPSYEFNKADLLYDNIKFIHNALNPEKGISAYYHKNDPNQNYAQLQVSNNQALPVVILGILLDDQLISLPIESDPIIKGRTPLSASIFKTIQFKLHHEFNKNLLPVANAKILYKILGTNIGHQEQIFEWPYYEKQSLEDHLALLNPNHNQFEFLNTNHDHQEITVKPGKWTLNQRLVIPKGYMLIAEKNTEINLVNSAKIISYSPLYFNGTQDQPIRIVSDGSGQGVVVLNARERSYLKNVEFHNLSKPKQKDWALTGAVNFYESPVTIEHCLFSNNRDSDDSLNIIRSDFTISKSLFESSYADALDIDFSRGEIRDSSFIDCGSEGDAIDFSGSVVKLSNITIKNALDKGLSIGEHSRVTANGVTITGANMAIASKDMSEVNLENINLSDYKIGLAAYQKKDEFGPASITVTNADDSNIGAPHFIEEGSIITINNSIIKTLEPLNKI